MTKSLQNIETITCDQCCKLATRDCSQQFFGGHPFGGWFHLERHRGSTQLEELHADHDWDFCSPKCLAQWVDESNYASNRPEETKCQMHDFRGGDGTPCIYCGLTVTELLDEGKL